MQFVTDLQLINSITVVSHNGNMSFCCFNTQSRISSISDKYMYYAIMCGKSLVAILAAIPAWKVFSSLAGR